MSQIRDPYDQIKRVRNRGMQIDTHELLKREIYNQSGSLSSGYDNAQINQANVTNVASSPGPAQSPPMGIEDTYLYFDSLAKDTSSNTANGELKFSITQINNSQPIDNCVEMQMGSFYFPLIKNATGAPEYYFFRRIYMQITTMPSTQAYLAPNAATYHFEFDIASTNSIAVLLTPVQPIFYLRQPLNTLTQFTVNFMVPSGIGSFFTKIPLPKDSLTVQATPGSSPATFTILGGDDISNLVTPIPGAFPNTPNPIISVYFSGFNSASQSLNTAVNSTQGVIINNFPTNKFTFQLSGIDFAALAAGTYVCTMYIPKNKISMGLKFSCIKSYNTNFLQPQHG